MIDNAEITTPGIGPEIIFDCLKYSYARSQINIAYIASSGALLPYNTTIRYKICPFRGGVNSTWYQLPISMEFLDPVNLFKLHTVEIHNPDICNVNSMNAERKNYLQISYEPNNKLQSLLLNGRPVIDVNYIRAFVNPSIQDHLLDFLITTYLSTRDGQNPSLCEMRVFVENF